MRAADGGSASLLHCADEAPLTAAVAADFGLEALEAFLEQPSFVSGTFGVDGRRETAPPADRNAVVELQFDVGELSYYEKVADADIACDDSIAAPAHVYVRIGTGLLSFEADGRLWKGRNEPSAHFYARADLAAATGSYRPTLDVERIHLGEIEISLHAAPGELRGDILPAVVYFRDEVQRSRYLQGEFQFVERPLLFALGFPDDVCEDHELPFAHDEAIERLGRRSADEWRAEAISLIGATAVVDAAWKDGRETEVTVELGDPVGLTACLSASLDHLAPSSEMALRIPITGRLRTTDARLDVPLDELVVGVDGGSIVRATLRNRLPPAALSEAQRDALRADAEVLVARLDYDLDGSRAPPDGIVELLVQTAPGSYSPIGCVAFPRGGKADLGSCRYRR